MTARVDEINSAIAVISSELRALCRALDCLSVLISENANNIDMIAVVLRAAGDDLECISGTEPEIE